MDRSSYIIQMIRDKAADVMPEGSKVVLFGSRARGDSHSNSDWDVLLLLNKEKINEDDHDSYSYPLFELGWEIDAQIHPIMFTLKEWEKRQKTSLYQNVEKEGIVLC